MNKSGGDQGQPASELTSRRIAELGDWRGNTLSRMRKLITEEDPDAVEEWRWMGTPIWLWLRRRGMRAVSERYKHLVLIAVCGWAAATSSVSAQTPGPGPEHKRLDVFVGVWTFEGESKAVPALGMTDAGKVSYRHVNQMANGGFFLETRRTGTSARGPVTELFVYSYNRVSKTYRQDAYDSRGRVRTFTGTVDGLRWSFSGMNTNPDGQVTQERLTLVYTPDLLSATVRSEHSKDGVTWYERVTGTYTKVSGMGLER